MNMMKYDVYSHHDHRNTVMYDLYDVYIHVLQKDLWFDDDQSYIRKGGSAD